jgi:hypothetical protein
MQPTNLSVSSEGFEYCIGGVVVVNSRGYLFQIRYNLFISKFFLLFAVYISRSMRDAVCQACSNDLRCFQVSAFACSVLSFYVLLLHGQSAFTFGRACRKAYVFIHKTIYCIFNFKAEMAFAKHDISVY